MERYRSTAVGIVIALLFVGPVSRAGAMTITTSCFVGIIHPLLSPTGECYLDYVQGEFNTVAVVLNVTAIRIIDGAQATGSRYRILNYNSGGGILGPVVITCNNVLSALEMSATGSNYEYRQLSGDPRVLTPVVVQVSQDSEIGPMGISQPPRNCINII